MKKKQCSLPIPIPIYKEGDNADYIDGCELVKKTNKPRAKRRPKYEEGDKEHEAKEQVCISSGSNFWCFTVYNTSVLLPDGSYNELFDKITEDYKISEEYKDKFASQNFTFLVCQVEQCPKTGRRHIQGYLELARKQRFDWIKKKVNDNSIMFGKRWGTLEQCINYCSKEESRVGEQWTFGSPKPDNQGKRTDIQRIKEAIDQGAKTKTLWNSFFPTMIRYGRGVSEYKYVVDLQYAKVYSPKTVIIITGAPGLGKTTYARSICGGIDYFIVKPSQNTVWYDGYDGEGTLIFDEFESWLRFSDLLVATDPYGSTEDKKGGRVVIQATRIIILTNKNYADLYPNVHNKAALTRRITVSIKMVKEADIDKVVEFLTPDINWPRSVLQKVIVQYDGYFKDLHSGDLTNFVKLTRENIEENMIANSNLDIDEYKADSDVEDGFTSDEDDNGQYNKIDPLIQLAEAEQDFEYYFTDFEEEKIKVSPVRDITYNDITDPYLVRQYKYDRRRKT